MVRKVLLFFQIIILIAGAIAVSANYVSPLSSTFPAYFGIFFPLIILINLILLIVWITLDRKGSWIAAVGLVLSLPYLGRSFNVSFGKSSEDSFKVMSFNVKNFDLYRWSENENTRVEIIKLVREEAPDIACFQEFYDADREPHLNVPAIQEALGDVHVAFATTFNQNGSRFGVAIFSRFEILDWEAIELENSKNNTALWADLLVGSDTLRVFNVHLQSINLGYDDYDYLESPQGNQDPTSSRRILIKMNKGLETRAMQAEQIAELVDVSPHPVLVCGDFNDGPMSYSYQTIKNGLQDAFVKKGVGFGRTYNKLSLPILRIDYILPSKELEVCSYKTYERKLSDHNPISAQLAWR